MLNKKEFYKYHRTFVVNQPFILLFPKKIFIVHFKDSFKENFEDWTQENLETDPHQKKAISINKLYENYVEYIATKKFSIPFRKKTFVTQLKKVYKEQEEMSRVEFFYEQRKTDRKDNGKSNEAEDSQERSKVRGLAFRPDSLVNKLVANSNKAQEQQ